MTPLVAEHQTLMDAALQPFPPPASEAVDLATHLRGDLVRLAWRALQPAGVLGRRWLADERAAAWLAGSTAHSDLDPTSPGGGAFALVLKLLGHAVGWGFPRGGAAMLGDALVARIRANGGEVRHDAAVAEVLLDGGARSVRGVRLRSGDVIEADHVVSTLSATPFLRLLPARALPRGV